jgi:hypothetical protein
VRLARSAALTMIGTALILALGFPARSNIYLDNPLRVVDRTLETYLAPIGELESGTGAFRPNGSLG